MKRCAPSPSVRRVAHLLLASALLAGCPSSKVVGTSGTGGSGGSGGTGGADGGTGGVGGGSGGSGAAGPCFDASDCTGLNDACNVGTCVNGACEKLPANNGSACDDGLYCTTGDSCQGGVCVGGGTVFCPSPDPCNLGSCDEATKSCKSTPGNNGAQCDDGDSCTYNGTCANGACAKGAPVDCSILDSDCFVGECQPGQGCVQVPANQGMPCDDGQFCTDNDVCNGSGVCGGQPKQCAPVAGCFISTCDEAANTCSAVPGNDGAQCDDNNACTSGTTCLGGLCVGGQPANEGLVCDDNTSCTMGEFCTAGVCGGGMGPTVFFAEDFSDNSAGWVLGPEWQIGAAQASLPGACSSADPATDHSPTADNGIAGVVIGGNAATVQHPAYWLESPAFDTSTAPGSVYFQFFRWLSSDYDPYMHNYVEVYDGAQWVELAVYDGPGCTADNAWTYISFDVTALKNPQMRVRFGFDIGSSGVYTIGSWNVDDVLVASGECP